MKKSKIGILVSRFNEEITQGLLEGCLATLKKDGYSNKDYDVFYVPGAFELPVAAARMAEDMEDISAIICLGAVIRGETPHFDYVSQEVARGIMNVAYDTLVPVIFGVLTTDTWEQAKARSLPPVENVTLLPHAKPKVGNKGTESASAALDMVKLWEKWDGVS